MKRYGRRDGREEGRELAEEEEKRRTAGVL